MTEITIQSEPLPLKFNLENEVAKVEKAKEIISMSDGADDQRVISSKAMIQKVPTFLRERPKSCEYYSPKLLSIGPIHHGKDNVKVGEQYKHMWTAMYLSRAKKEQHAGSGSWKIMDEYTHFKDRIIKVIEQCYSEDVIEEKHKENNYEALAWMLFVDGCSVLEFMDKASFQNPQVLKIKIDQLILMQQDLLLLENQIPFELLQLLCPDPNDLSSSMLKFLKLHNMVPESAKKLQLVPQPIHPQPTHLLDYLRNKILCADVETAINVKQEKNEKSRLCGIESLRDMAELAAGYVLGKDNCIEKRIHKKKQKKKKNWLRQRNIQELKEAGIIVTSLEEENIRNIRFSSHLFFGRLYLPSVIVDDSTATTYMNLIAYEMCPNFKNDFAISSYLAFLDSLIDHSDDVKELRSAGVLHNNLGSDEEVANLFNTITTDLVPDPAAYELVRKNIMEHCKRRTKTWMAEFTYTHFQSPWSFLALLAAILVLALTCVQTYYTMPHPE